MTFRRHAHKQLLPVTSVSATTTYTSDWMDISTFNTVGAAITTTGTATGTVTIEVAYELAQPADPGVRLPLNPKAVSFYVNSAIVANISTSGANTYVLETGITSATWFRIKYVNATNSGTIQADVVAKVIG